MPIKPENLARYPADWPAIRQAILQRAGHRCEQQGPDGHRCGARQRALGYWRLTDTGWLPVGFEHLQRQAWHWEPLPAALRDAGVDKPMTLNAADGTLKVIRIVLTVAHLDHQPENCSEDNLRALCQRHHLAHDFHHHRANAQATRRARAGTFELF